MKTIITITFYHDNPHAIEFIKDFIRRKVKDFFNIKEVSILHENK